MTRRARVLVVDDSVVVRKAVSEMLSSDPLIEVIGTASNGKLALERVVQLSPDLVVLDLEMPEMDGLETLRRLRALHPNLPVLIFSALTEKGAMLTLDALSLGASDYVTKPANVGKHQVTLERVQKELIEKTHALTAEPDIVRRRTTRANVAAGAAVSAPARVEVVVIGASTGGPKAISELFEVLRPRLEVPILVVQHMPPVFTRTFAERLAALHGLDVKEGRPGEAVRPGSVWIAPGDFHMVVADDGDEVRLSTHQGAPENSCRPAVDPLFRSAAACYGPGVLGVVLTGMGQDGLRGAEEIRRAGGRVLVQDEASSVVWSMPGCIAKAGLSDQVLGVRELGLEILRRVDPTRAGAVSAVPTRGAT